MAFTDPTYYNVEEIDQNGAMQADMVKALYNLWKAVAAICNKADDWGVGSHWMAMVGTDLDTAMANLKTPRSGATT